MNQKYGGYFTGGKIGQYLDSDLHSGNSLLPKITIFENNKISWNYMGHGGAGRIGFVGSEFRRLDRNLRGLDRDGIDGNLVDNHPNHHDRLKESLKKP